ncbi:MAG: BCCT family transporter [Pseudomonadota bacterium]
MTRNIRPLVFWPPALILLSAVTASLIDFDGFLAIATAAHQWLLARIGWLFSLGAFAAVALIVGVAASPLGRVRIGGADAKPILKRWNWFAITLCTTIATGILFWGASEPIMHFNAPPAFAGAEARTMGAAEFSLSTLFLHWTFTPYAIYTVPALAFALAYYNLGRAYSLSAPLSLAFGRLATGAGAAVIDAVALFALVAGVAASLGAGMITLAGGLNAVFGLPDGAVTRFFVTAFIVAAFVLSSITGLQRGIKSLSDINIRVFFALVGFVLIAGPTVQIAALAVSALSDYAATFLPRSVLIFDEADTAWRQSWTMFYFANWAAWAPITALFLGRISVGYTVREMILFTFVLPSIFGMIWMTVFGGAALSLDGLGTVASGGGTGSLTKALNAGGVDAVIYALFEALPLTALTVGLFVFATFISFVTAMDSNTHSIASVCLKAQRQSDETPGAGLWVKVFWGVLIGGVAWIMTATKGVDGVRMLSNLGGAPGLIILIGSIIALTRLAAMGPTALSAANTPSSDDHSEAGVNRATTPSSVAT